jgi:hypothetical protein
MVQIRFAGPSPLSPPNRITFYFLLLKQGPNTVTRANWQKIKKKQNKNKNKNTHAHKKHPIEF